eukprot:10411647-Lingulodinium_polyedra.AAC.1
MEACCCSAVKVPQGTSANNFRPNCSSALELPRKNNCCTFQAVGSATSSAAKSAATLCFASP